MQPPNDRTWSGTLQCGPKSQGYFGSLTNDRTWFGKLPNGRKDLGEIVLEEISLRSDAGVVAHKAHFFGLYITGRYGLTV